MSNLVKVEDIVNRDSMDDMSEQEIRLFTERNIGTHVGIDLLIDVSCEPPCPAAIENQVVTDIPSQTWGHLMVRVGEMLGIRDVRVSQPLRARNNYRYLYRKDVFMKIHDRMSQLVAFKARKARAPIRSEDIHDYELIKLLVDCGYDVESLED